MDWNIIILMKLFLQGLKFPEESDREPSFVPLRHGAHNLFMWEAVMPTLFYSRPSVKKIEYSSVHLKMKTFFGDKFFDCNTFCF